MAASQSDKFSNEREEFGVLVKGIASELVPEDLQVLCFLEGVEQPREASALQVFSAMMKKGKFGHCKVQPLRALLKSIQRVDLVTKYLDTYSQSSPTNGQECVCVFVCVRVT